MPDQNALIFLAILGLTAGTSLLAIYAFGMYRLGVHCAHRFPRAWSAARGMTMICLAWLAVGGAILFIPGHPLVLLTGFISAFSVSAYPQCIGYAAGRYFRDEEEHKRYSRNVDKWLSEWEYRDEESDNEFNLADLDSDWNSGESNS